ncbi:uncharacterized protein M6B38_407980 [Iris pallida]|uniref:Uncharacterized protein n=1 Tax=Iris pallida TaxID=29817 RepID=A0AAX6FQD6_IRIPA|nr:uncharacterized protein M6B38_407980 [Iris pallida]
MLKSTTAPSGSGGGGGGGGGGGTTLVYPGKMKMDQCFGAAPPTARAREIARSREELLGLLRGLPEPEFELSLTDLVESSAETEDRLLPVINQQERRPVKERIKKARKSSSSFERSSSSSSGGGVLLNMYVPTSLTRSLTSSGGSRRSSAGPKDHAADQFTIKRDTKVPILFSCWSTIWYGKSDKSRRRKAAQETQLRQENG